MNRTLLFSALVASLLLAACAQTPAAAPAPTPQQAQSPGSIPPPTPAPPQEVTNNNQMTLDPLLPMDIRATAEKGIDRVNTGYGYTYTKLVNDKLAPETANQITVLQKAAVRKIVFYKPIQLDATFFMAGMVLDTKDQTAMAYCVDHRCGGDTGVPAQRRMTYSDFNFVTPTDWLGTMRSVQIVGQEQLSGRATTKVTAKVNDVDTTLWIDTYSGLVVKAEQGVNDYLYTSLVLTVKDSELQP